MSEPTYTQVNCGKEFEIGTRKMWCNKKPGHEDLCATRCQHRKETRDTYGHATALSCANDAKKIVGSDPYSFTALCEEHFDLRVRERRAKAIGQAQLFRVLAAQIEATEEPIKIPHELRNIFAGLLHGIYND